MRKLSVVFSSHKDNDYNQKFIEHLKQTAGVEIHVECIVNMNQYSLTEAYNLAWKKLDELGRGKDIIVFCHNDITIKTKNWGKILVNLFRHFPDYDVLGVAGSKKILAHGVWYLDESGKLYQQNTHMFGRVWHRNGITQQMESVYSTKISGIQPVVIVDGLFFAVNGETILKRFNENFKGFHYYDVSFCFENYLEGCNIGVIDKITVLHESQGRTNEEWNKNRLQFVEHYKEELPVIL
jgi:hypothetical protein